MTSSMMNIPEKINVGYQKRGGTYTGKLGYVIYFDAKGKLRKETSWEGWRDKKIKNDIIANEPMEGFVLNRKAGGVGSGWGWNDRIAKVRVYDPRDFEFEISIPNLLFILQECTSIKGKGLEGEFVYAWEGKELVLLPCCSKEYEKCKKYTASQSAKVTKDQVVEGCTYQMKDMNNVMYLGRHSWFSLENDWSSDTSRKYLKPCGKKHIFINVKHLKKKNPEYITETGFTKLAQRTSDEAISDYPDIYEKLINSFHCLLPTKVNFEKVNLTEQNTEYGKHVFIKDGDNYYPAHIVKKSNYYYSRSDHGEYVVSKAKKPFTIPEIINGSINLTTVEFNRYRGSTDTVYTDKTIEVVNSFQVLQTRDFYMASMVNSKGATYKLIET